MHIQFIASLSNEQSWDPIRFNSPTLSLGHSSLYEEFKQDKRRELSGKSGKVTGRTQRTEFLHTPLSRDPRLTCTEAEVVPGLCSPWTFTRAAASGGATRVWRRRARILAAGKRVPLCVTNRAGVRAKAPAGA